MIPKSLQSSYYECALNQRLHVYQENTFDMDWFKCSREKKAPLQAIEKIAKQVQTFIENTGSVQNNYVLQDIKDEDFFQIQTQGYGLYAGFVGQLIFLAAYAKFSSDPKISALVKRYAEELLDFIQSEFFIFKEGRSGLGGGCQSLLYGLYTLSQLGFIVIPPHCLSRFFSIEPKLWAAPIVDLIDGVSGDIILQRHFLKHVPDDIYKRQSSLLSTLSRSLLLEWDKNSNDRKKIGLAHGALGPAWACALIFKQTGNEEFKKYAEDLICKEKEMITGIHAKNPSGYENNNWCYGNAGKALAYHEIGKLLNDDVFQSEAIRMADFKNKEKLKFLDPSLCCGAAGYFAAYTYILQPGLGRSEIENIEALKSEYVRLMSCVEPFEAQKKHMNLGLFKGASGFGYALLYYILPEKIPPVWVFG